MPKYKIGGSYGYAGTDWEDEIEAEDEADAEDQAREQTLQRVEWWFKLIEDESTEARHDG